MKRIALTFVIGLWMLSFALGCGGRVKILSSAELPEGGVLTVERTRASNGLGVKVLLVHTGENGGRAGAIIDHDSPRFFGSASIVLQTNIPIAIVTYGNRHVAYNYRTMVMTNHHGDPVKAGTDVL